MLSRIKAIKEKFCLDVVIKLDKIINRCLSKKLKEQTTKELQDSQNFKQFAHTFEENKDKLREHILKIENINKAYEFYLNELYTAYREKDYKKTEEIYNILGFNERIRGQ